MTSKLIEALNKCETQKSYENVRYTLIDDELRDYIEESLERLESLEKENQELKEEIQDLKDNETIVADYGIYLWNENEKLKKVIEILKDRVRITVKIPYAWVETKDNCVYFKVNQQEYELLSEVLGE